MGNVNELQEREANSIDDVDSSSFERDSSSDSIAISEQKLFSFTDCLAIENNAESTRDQSMPPLQYTSTSIDSPKSEIDDDAELAINNTCDDSLPLSESAIPVSFEIEDLSPLPSDNSDVFHTPNISQSDIEEHEATNQLDSPLCLVQACPEQEHIEQCQQQTDAEPNRCRVSPAPVEIVDRFLKNENFDCRTRSENAPDIICQPILQNPNLEDESLQIVAAVENNYLPLAKNAESELEGPESKGHKSGSLLTTGLLIFLPETQNTIAATTEDLSCELPAEVLVGGSPVVAKSHPRQHDPPSCGFAEPPELVPHLAGELSSMTSSEALIEMSEGNDMSLSVQVLTERPSSEIQEPALIITETPLLLSTTVSTPFTAPHNMSLKVQEYASTMPFEPLTGALIMPAPTPKIPSPLGHTADRPNWALAPDSPPKPKVASPRKRRKRAPRRGKQANNDSGTGNHNSMPSSSKAEGVVASKIIPKSRTSTNTASFHEYSSHGKVPHLSIARSSTFNDSKDVQNIPSIVDHANDISQLPKNNTSATFAAPQTEFMAQIREGLLIDAPALPVPVFKQTDAALDQLHLENIDQHEKKASASPAMIKDQAGNLCCPDSLKHNLLKGSKGSGAVNPAIKEFAANISKDLLSSASNDFNQASDDIHLFRPSILASIDKLDPSAPYWPPSGSGTSTLPTITEINPLQGDKEKAIKINSYQASPKRAIRHDVKDVSTPKTTARLHTETRRIDPQRHAESLVPNFVFSLPEEPRSSRLHKGLSWPVIKEDLRYSPNVRPLLLRGSAVVSSALPSSLTTGSTLPSFTTEKELHIPHPPSDGTSDAFMAATYSQHMAFHESLAADGEIPTARVNLPTKRSNSMAKDQVHEENRLGHRIPFQSGIPVLTKKHMPKGFASRPGQGPFLLPHIVCRSVDTQDDRVSPAVTTVGSSSQNTCYKSGFTQITRSTSHPYARHSGMGAAVRTRSAFAVHQNTSSNPEHCSTRSLEPIHVEHIYGTHISTSAPIYLFPTGTSQSQVSMHHNTGYRTRHEHRQGSLQPGNVMSIGQLQNAGYTAGLVHETSILRAPLRRQLRDSFHRSPDGPNNSN